MKYLLSKTRLQKENFKNFESESLALKFLIHNVSLSPAIRWEAGLILSRLGKTSSRVFLKNRCFLTGRGRGYSRFFNLSRIQVRDFARSNELLFVTKHSW